MGSAVHAPDWRSVVGGLFDRPLAPGGTHFQYLSRA
jgi:hypothetical protein